MLCLAFPFLYLCFGSFFRKLDLGFGFRNLRDAVVVSNDLVYWVLLCFACVYYFFDKRDNTRDKYEECGEGVCGKVDRVGYKLRKRSNLTYNKRRDEIIGNSRPVSYNKCYECKNADNLRLDAHCVGG